MVSLDTIQGFDISFSDYSKRIINIKIKKSFGRFYYFLQIPIEPFKHLIPSSQVALFKLAPSKFASKIYRWFNCLAYSTLAALISRVLIFPNGILEETSYFMRLIVIFSSILIFYATKKNLVYPTIFSAIMLSILSNYIG